MIPLEAQNTAVTSSHCPRRSLGGSAWSPHLLPDRLLYPPACGAPLILSPRTPARLPSPGLSYTWRSLFTGGPSLQGLCGWLLTSFRSAVMFSSQRSLLSRCPPQNRNPVALSPPLPSLVSLHSMSDHWTSCIYLLTVSALNCLSVTWEQSFVFTAFSPGPRSVPGT